MNPEVIMICPEIARGSGGLADYTLRVVHEWNGRIPVRFIIPEPKTGSGKTIARNRAALLKELPARGGRVLLQYSAYGFDHFGYPRWLLQALVDWKKSAGGLLVLMLHEIWTFWPVLNKNHLVQQLHRRALRTLVSCADAVFTSTPSQAGHLRKLAPTVTVQVLPVGSNIAPSSDVPEKREPGFAVLFGLQGARLRALRALQTDLHALASASRLTSILTMGGGNSSAGDREESEILRALPLSRGAEKLGPLSEEEISALFARASFGISDQDELSLTKSGTFMAYAASGLNILSPLAGATKPEPLCWLIHPEEMQRGLADDELMTRAKNLRAWQERTSSWPVIACHFASALSL